LVFLVHIRSIFWAVYVVLRSYQVLFWSWELRLPDLTCLLANELMHYTLAAYCLWFETTYVFFLVQIKCTSWTPFTTQAELCFLCDNLTVIPQRLSVDIYQFNEEYIQVVFVFVIVTYVRKICGSFFLCVAFVAYEDCLKKYNFVSSLKLYNTVY